MHVALLIFIVLVFLFAFVLLFGAPYLPTLKPQKEQALDLLKLKPGQTLLELGCGDGRVARAAARRGIRVVGYELNPFLVIIAKITSVRYRKLVTIKLADYWHADWPEANGIYVFLLEKYMKKLDKKVAQQRKRQKKQIRLVSYTFQIPDRKADGQKGPLFLYKYR